MAAVRDEALGDDSSAAVAELRRRAEAVAQDFRTRAAEAERERRVPAENMAQIRESGLLRVIQSRGCGGHELSMRAHLDVISAIAEGCSATAWVLGVMHAHSWMMAHFPGEAREDVYGADPDTMISAVIAPRGKAVLNDDGSCTLNGFWPFGSGCEHASWLLLGAEISDSGGALVDLADFLVPAREVDIQDDWFVAGLAGTGSCSIKLDGLRVPAHRRLSIPALIEGRTPGMEEGYDGWLHKAEAVPVLALCLCGGALGLARAALAEFRRTVQAKPVAYTPHIHSEWSATHIKLGEAASLIDAAHLMLYRVADDIDSHAQSGTPMTIEMRARIRMDCSQGVRFALEGAEKLFLMAGGSSLALRSPLQQASRDLHAINMHGLLLPEASAELYGRVLLGLEPNTDII